VVEKSKPDEFRRNNVTVIKERDELKKRFEGIDPDQVRQLLEEKQKLELQAHGQTPGSLNASRILPGSTMTRRCGA
jgi:hypothetical protein